MLERRRLFPFLTVLDNLLLGAHNPAARRHRDDTLARVEHLFPSSPLGARSSRTRCRAGSSRWSPSRVGSWPARACS